MSTSGAPNSNGLLSRADIENSPLEISPAERMELIMFMTPYFSSSPRPAAPQGKGKGKEREHSPEPAPEPERHPRLEEHATKLKILFDAYAAYRYAGNPEDEDFRQEIRDLAAYRLMAVDGLLDNAAKFNPDLQDLGG